MQIETLSKYINFIKEQNKKINNIFVFKENYIKIKIEEANKNVTEQEFYHGKYSTEHINALASLKYLESLLKDFHEQAKNTILNPVFFYRGQYMPTRRISEYKLIPSVFREKFWDKESYFYHEIMLRCPEEFKGFLHLDRLVHMQHYNCPTRLRDVTSNPLVALFFTCKNFDCNECDKSSSGKVYMFCVPGNDLAYSDSDRIVMLSCLPVFKEDFKQKLFDLAAKSGIYFDLNADGTHYDSYEVEKFYHEITIEIPAFQRHIETADLLKPLFVQPGRINRRMFTQSGAFIISGLSRNVDQAEGKIMDFVAEEIIIKNQDEILNDLDMLGINEASLFSDLGHTANYLKEKV